MLGTFSTLAASLCATSYLSVSRPIVSNQKKEIKVFQYDISWTGITLKCPETFCYLMWLENNKDANKYKTIGWWGLHWHGIDDKCSEFRPRE